MQITKSAISLNVDDPEASAAFAERHLGFTRQMDADGFVALGREDAGFNLIFLRPGLPRSSRRRSPTRTRPACSWCSRSTTSTPSTPA